MIRNVLPYFITKALFGDRKQFGIYPDISDGDWLIWQEKAFSDFYYNTQQRGIGNWVCNLAYPVVEKIDFKGKTILEVGPGIIRHLKHISNMPTKYCLCDINSYALKIAQEQLYNANVPCETILLDREGVEMAGFPFPEKSFDVIISFNSLEHLNSLDRYLNEIKRILKKGGQLIGGIPCEGGLAWGLGRFLTTRRYVFKNYGINYDKIICWEHPNFADFIIERLDAHFEREHLKLHPFSWLPIDFNLVASFIYKQI
jgi:SAM-dependent methyltransferase